MRENPEARKLIEEEITLMVLSTTMHNDIYPPASAAMNEVAQALKPLYMSYTRVQAFEDCINFVPHLFRLTKSIIVSEPLTTFTNQLKSRLGRDTDYLNKVLADSNPKDASNPFRKPVTDSDASSKVTHYKDHAAVTMQNKFNFYNKGRNTKAKTVSFAKSAEPEAPLLLKAKEQKKHLGDYRIKFNYGVMMDFLNYSGMGV